MKICDRIFADYTPDEESWEIFDGQDEAIAILVEMEFEELAVCFDDLGFELFTPDPDWR